MQILFISFKLFSSVFTIRLIQSSESGSVFFLPYHKVTVFILISHDTTVVKDITNFKALKSLKSLGRLPVRVCLHIEFSYTRFIKGAKSIASRAHLGRK